MHPVIVTLPGWSSRTVLWFARFGPNQTAGAALTGWIGRAISGLQSLIQTTELRRVLESGGGRDRNVGDLLRETFSLASSLEPLANQRALALLDIVLGETPDDPLGLALAAWCHVQRSIYQWSANPESDGGDAERFAQAATSPGANDPNCLTILGTTRTMLADQSSARSLLVRALELNPYPSWAHARIGWVDVYLGRPERATHHLQTSLRLAPRGPGTAQRVLARPAYGTRSPTSAAISASCRTIRCGANCAAPSAPQPTARAGLAIPGTFQHRAAVIAPLFRSGPGGGYSSDR